MSRVRRESYESAFLLVVGVLWGGVRAGSARVTGTRQWLIRSPESASVGIPTVAPPGALTVGGVRAAVTPVVRCARRPGHQPPRARSRSPFPPPAAARDAACALRSTRAFEHAARERPVSGSLGRGQLAMKTGPTSL